MGVYVGLLCRAWCEAWAFRVLQALARTVRADLMPIWLSLLRDVTHNFYGLTIPHLNCTCITVWGRFHNNWIKSMKHRPPYPCRLAHTLWCSSVPNVLQERMALSLSLIDGSRKVKLRKGWMIQFPKCLHINENNVIYHSLQSSDGWFSCFLNCRCHVSGLFVTLFVWLHDCGNLLAWFELKLEEECVESQATCHNFGAKSKDGLAH